MNPMILSIVCMQTFISTFDGLPIKKKKRKEKYFLKTTVQNINHKNTGILRTVFQTSNHQH